MLRILFYGFLIYTLYQLIFHFIIPVYRTTRQVKKGFHEMQDRMNDHINKQQSAAQEQASQKTQKQAGGDYIEFEEVK